MSVFVVAEMSANHCGQLDVAKRVIAEAKACGADAVKAQTYTADTMTLDCKADCFKVHGSGQWDGQYLYDLYRGAGLPWEWHAELKAYADKKHIEYHSIEELVNSPEIHKMMEERINNYQKDLASYEQIKRFVLLPKAFTMESGELTNTLKIKRAVINKRYRPLIDAMYAADYRKKNKSADKSTDE